MVSFKRKWFFQVYLHDYVCLIFLQGGQISLEEYKEWASTRRFSHLFPKLLVQVSVELRWVQQILRISHGHAEMQKHE